MHKRNLESTPENPILSRLISMMNTNRNRLKSMLHDVTDEMLDYSPSMEKIETIGSLLEHIAGVDWSWIFEDIDGKEMKIEEWRYAFPLRSGDTEQPAGNPKSYYVEKIDGVRQEVLQRLTQFNDQDLTQKFTTADNDVEFTLDWVLYHLINHEALHEGQISMLKRFYHLNVQ